MNIIERMYRILLTMPCKCDLKWKHGEERPLCARCQVIEDYERERISLEAQSV